MSSRKCRECGKEFLSGESECNWCAPAFAERHAQGYTCKTCGSRLPDGRTCPFCAQNVVENFSALAEEKISDVKEENFLLASFTVMAIIASMFALHFVVRRFDAKILFIAFALLIALIGAFNLASSAKKLLRNQTKVTEIKWLRNIGAEISNPTLAATIAARFFYVGAILLLVVSIALSLYVVIENPHLRAINKLIPLFTAPLFVFAFLGRAFVRTYIKRHCT
ncbi:hypothetical protein SAMN05421829_1032 [Aromatoleum tolulyticum]|uniref:Double zinc ribbon n=1 Tax=Aromatoleum tolulyticum TaxID=34027 RepID=A0A1N6QWG4_9RHOO|nr:hypothetical protein [Aromatoleum tolulyticum]SIQ20961.1 hypothetical protein SAMN05421829_1032 [Aromatoleum tolulyticum]